jgi:magnesium chelatase subunit I
MNKAVTLGELRASGFQTRSVKDEMRANLIKKLKSGEKLFRLFRNSSTQFYQNII